MLKEVADLHAELEDAKTEIEALSVALGDIHSALGIKYAAREPMLEGSRATRRRCTVFSYDLLLDFFVCDRCDRLIAHIKKQTGANYEAFIRTLMARPEVVEFTVRVPH